MARTKVQKREKDQLNLKNIHSSFTKNLRSLEVFISNVAPIAERHDKKTKNEINKFLRQINRIATPDKIQRDNKTKTVTVQVKDEETAQKFIGLLRNIPRISLPQAELLYRSSFVMLMSYLDFLISDLIHYFYQKYPDSLSRKELQLSLSDLKRLGSIVDAIDYIINKEVENILYDNLVNQKLYFKNTLNIDTRDSIINWDRLMEAMERRHIVVHNDCKINKRYLANVNLAIVPEKSKALKEGGIVQITDEYFNRVFEEVCVAGLILIQVCWRKWEKADRENVDGQLIADIYDILVKEDWTCAERLGLFSHECDVMDQYSRLVLNVNYCQSLKWQGKEKELKEELKKFDISALSPKFILAVCALKSDRDGFYDNIENSIIVDEMTEEYFMDWPLFRELREDPEYNKRVRSIFESVAEKARK